MPVYLNRTLPSSCLLELIFREDQATPRHPSLTRGLTAAPVAGPQELVLPVHFLTFALRPLHVRVRLILHVAQAYQGGFMPLKFSRERFMANST